MSRNVIGRHAELEAAQRHLDSLQAAPAAFVIEGEPGIGKTTLWEAVVELAAQRGFTTLLSHPAEAEAELSLTGLGDLLADVLEEVLPALPQPQRRAIEVALLREDPGPGGVDFRALGTAMLTTLDRLARHRPVIVAIDDVQWLDRPTHRVLDFALRRVREQPVGLVVATRPTDESLEDHRTLAEAFPRERVVAIHLGPLSLAGLHHVIVERFGEALTRPMLTRLEQASGGNPLLALEIVADLRRGGRLVTAREILPAPADIRRLVDARVGTLPQPVRRLLVTVAALGRPRLEELASVSGGDLDLSLAQAAAAGLIVIEDGRVQFVHPLFGSAVYEAASAAQRRRVHLALADALASPEESARHLAQATTTPDEAAAARIEAAAGQAAARGAPDAAASLLEHARRLTPGDREGDRSRRGLLLGHVLWEVGDVVRSRAVVDEAVSLMSPGSQRAVGRLLMAIQALWAVGTDAALEQCLLALADAGDDPVLKATIHFRMANVAEERAEFAMRHVRLAIEILDALGAAAPDELLACVLLFDAELRLRVGEPPDDEAIARGRRLLPPLPDPPVRALALNALGIARERDWLLRERADDLAGARDTLQALHRHDQETGVDRGAPIVLHDLALLECWLGNLEVAETHATDAAELAGQTGQTSYARACALLAHATVAAHQGRIDEAARVALEGDSMAVARGDEVMRAHFRAIRGFAALSAGRPADAAADFATARTALEAAGLRHPSIFRFRGDEIEALVLAGDVAAAGDRLAELEAAAQRSLTPWTMAIGSRARALVAAANGDPGGAIALLEIALGHHATLPMPVEHGRTLLLKGRLHRRRKEKRLASDALREALGIFERVGAAAWIDHARRELARVGLRPAAPDTLTPTEEQVATLAASGLTNRQVADALVLSPKSIDGVLGRIYRKLGINSRAELGARMARRTESGDHPFPRDR